MADLSQTETRTVISTRQPTDAKTAVGRHPIHAALVPFPIVCFTLALLTDIAYWQTVNLMWQNFSSWLLLAGLVSGVLAGVAGAIDLFSRRQLRSHTIGLVQGFGNLGGLVLALINSLVHARDGWTAVVPTGLILSAVTVFVMTVTVWLGRTIVYREAAGVRIHD